MREVAGVYSGFGLAAVETHAHGDFVLVHHGLALLFGVAFGAAALFGHQDIAEPHFDFIGVQIFDTGIADGGEQTARFGSLAKKAVLTKGEWAMA